MTRAATKRLAGCEGKVRFPTFSQAKRQARLSAQRHKLAFTPYHCGFCGGVHVGTTIGPTGEHPDQRNGYCVYAKNTQTSEETLIGFSRHADGRELIGVLGEGWYITRVEAKQ